VEKSWQVRWTTDLSLEVVPGFPIEMSAKVVHLRAPYGVAAPPREQGPVLGATGASCSPHQTTRRFPGGEEMWMRNSCGLVDQNLSLADLWRLTAARSSWHPFPFPAFFFF